MARIAPAWNEEKRNTSRWHLFQIVSRLEYLWAYIVSICASGGLRHSGHVFGQAEQAHPATDCCPSPSRDMHVRGWAARSVRLMAGIFCAVVEGSKEARKQGANKRSLGKSYLHQVCLVGCAL